MLILQGRTHFPPNSVSWCKSSRLRRPGRWEKDTNGLCPAGSVVVGGRYGRGDPVGEKKEEAANNKG